MAEEAIGSYIRYTYPIGIPLRQKDITKHQMATVLEPSPDQRAVSVMLDEKCAVEGFVTAGRYVDVIYTYRDPQGGGSGTITLVENSRVLSLNKDPLPVKDLKATEARPYQATGVYTATLSASPGDVNKIILAQTDGNLCFSLRGTGALDSGTPGVFLTKDLRASNNVIPTPRPASSKCNDKAFIRDRDKTLVSECNSTSRELEEPF